MTHKNVILASSSAYRLAQLRQIGIVATPISPNIDESPLHLEHPREHALRLAQNKTQAISTQSKSHIIIAGDQTASVEGLLLGKPKTRTNAIQQLTLCSAKQAIFYSALCVRKGDTKLSSVIETRVTFRTLSQSQIETYVDKEQPFDCAGSFKCEALGIALFKSITSEDPSALVGLPLISVVNLLSELNYDVLGR